MQLITWGYAMGSVPQVFFDLHFEGWEYTDDDLELLREEFEPLGLVHVSGQWGPAAIPAATVEVVLTFLGQTFVGVVIEKAMEGALHQLRDAWRRYRERRAAKGLEEPEIYRLQLRASDFAVEVNGVIDPAMDSLVEVLALMCDRRASGKLKDLVIARIVLPCHQYEGQWRTVEPEEYADTGDMYVWYVQPRTVLPPLGFYDARSDEWLVDQRI